MILGIPSGSDPAGALAYPIPAAFQCNIKGYGKKSRRILVGRKSGGGGQGQKRAMGAVVANVGPGGVWRHGIEQRARILPESMV